MKSEHADILKEARELYEQCRDGESHNRETFVDDTKFVKLGEQWPESIKQQRERDGRPCLTNNKLLPITRQVVNDSRQNKPQIKVKAADSHADPEVAEIYNGLIRNIEHVSNADVAYDTSVEHAVTGGFGYIRAGIDYAFDDAFDMDITIDRVLNPLSVYGDPASVEADGSDWNIAFVTERITKSEFKRRYPKAEARDFEADEWGELDDDWMNEDGVLIAEFWRREEVEKEIVRLDDGRVMGVEELEANPDLQLQIEQQAIRVTGERIIKSHRVTQRIISGLEVLETNPWRGKYIPIVPVYGDEFVVDGKRYFRSLIHPAKDAQRMHNYWRTTGTELVALAPRVPWTGPTGMFSSDDGWNTANTKNHPYLEWDPVPEAPGASPQRQPLDMGVAAGSMQEALNASDDIKSTTGLYDASMGARSNETSGKAIMARQREGDVSTFHFGDNLSRSIRHLGRVIIDLIPQIYNEERIIRVLGEDMKESTVPINQPVPQRGPDGQPMLDERGEAITRVFDLSLGKYDLAVSTGPSFTTQREEGAQTLQEIIRVNSDAAPILGAPLVRMMDFPDAEKIAEKLEKIDPTNENRLPPDIKQKMDEGMQHIQKLTAENQELKADQQGRAMDAQLEMAKLKLDAEKLQFEREKFAAEVRLSQPAL